MSPGGLSPTPDPVAEAEAELVAAQAHLEEALHPHDAAAAPAPVDEPAPLPEPEPAPEQVPDAAPEPPREVAAADGAAADAPVAAVIAPALDLSASPPPDAPDVAEADVRVRWLPDGQTAYPALIAGRWWNPGSEYEVAAGEAASLLAQPFFSRAPGAAGG